MPGFLSPPLAPAQFRSLEKELGEELSESSGENNDGADNSKVVGFPRPGRNDLGGRVLGKVLDQTVTGY